MAYDVMGADVGSRVAYPDITLWVNAAKQPHLDDRLGPVTGPILDYVREAYRSGLSDHEIADDVFDQFHGSIAEICIEIEDGKIEVMVQV